MSEAHTLDLVALQDAWESDKTRQEIAQEFRIPYRTLLKIAREEKWEAKERASKTPLPTPEEIQQRAAEIRKKWTPSEERKHAICKTSTSWQPRVITYNVSRNEFEAQE